MKLRVEIGEESYEVEVGDLHARPIVARIADEEFAVWPESGAATPVPGSLPLTGSALTNGNGVHAGPEAAPTNGARPAPANGAGSGQAIHAPLPGTILSILVGEGDLFEAGQDICVLEAMKMQNTIRAPHAGRVTRIRVAVGQSVQHHDVLLEYGD